MEKLIIPSHPLPHKSNKDLFWILTHVIEELNKAGRFEEARELEVKIVKPPSEATYTDLVQTMRN